MRRRWNSRRRHQRWPTPPSLASREAGLSLTHLPIRPVSPMFGAPDIGRFGSEREMRSEEPVSRGRRRYQCRLMRPRTRRTRPGNSVTPTDYAGSRERDPHPEPTASLEHTAGKPARPGHQPTRPQTRASPTGPPLAATPEHLSTQPLGPHPIGSAHRVWQPACTSASVCPRSDDIDQADIAGDQFLFSATGPPPESARQRSTGTWPDAAPAGQLTRDRHDRAE